MKTMFTMYLCGFLCTCSVTCHLEEATDGLHLRTIATSRKHKAAGGGGFFKKTERWFPEFVAKVPVSLWGSGDEGVFA